MLGKLGIIEFFGILVPGAYLGGGLSVIPIVVLLSGEVISGNQLHTIVSKNAWLLTPSFLLVSYLLGMTMRLVAPDVVDRSSTWYFRLLRWKCLTKTVDKHKQIDKDNLWVFEKFPYKRSMERTLRKRGMIKVISSVKGLNSRYALSFNTAFFLFCKVFLEANSQEVGKRIQQAEAKIRFLAGTVIGLALVLVAWSIVGISLGWEHGRWLFGGAALNLLALMPMLARFKHQRRGEVMLVWISVYLMITGGIPRDESVSKDDMMSAVQLNG